MSETLRMRVFAGPNGSGKSTVIKYLKALRVNNQPIDFGIYINADDIAVCLTDDTFSFKDYNIEVTRQQFTDIALASGLVGDDFNEEVFGASFRFRANRIHLLHADAKERLAQIIADFLRKTLLQAGKKFSFETVFSHHSKLDIMKEAAAAGYKVYLYFVSTESADINVYRVSARKQKGGHDVPEDKIRGRYQRSLDLLYDASQLAYQAFYFDNSEDGKTDVPMFAHFKLVSGKKKWDDIDEDQVPEWFARYYSDKV
ncbi:MAG: hypothetical protein ACK4EY_07460 [Flavipsychrobacter sp.]